MVQRRQVLKSRNRRSILHPDTTEPSAHTREPEQHRSVQPRLSRADTHAHSTRSLMGLCLGELFLSAVYERQHVRESTCPRIARVPLAGSPATAHGIGLSLQPVVAARVAHWPAVRALTVLPTHVSPVCTVSRGASRAYYFERGVNTRTQARTHAHARAPRPPPPSRPVRCTICSMHLMDTVVVAPPLSYKKHERRKSHKSRHLMQHIPPITLIRI